MTLINFLTQIITDFEPEIVQTFDDEYYSDYYEAYLEE